MMATAAIEWHRITAEPSDVIVERYGHEGQLICDRTPTDDDADPCYALAVWVRFPGARLRPVFACDEHKDWLTGHEL